jgi:hypothetical protein
MTDNRGRRSRSCGSRARPLVWLLLVLLLVAAGRTALAQEGAVAPAAAGGAWILLHEPLPAAGPASAGAGGYLLTHPSIEEPSATAGTGTPCCCTFIACVRGSP